MPIIDGAGITASAVALRAPILQVSRAPRSPDNWSFGWLLIGRDTIFGLVGRTRLSDMLDLFNYIFRINYALSEITAIRNKPSALFVQFFFLKNFHAPRH